MQYSEKPPSPHLAEFIKCFWSIEDSSGSAGNAPEPVVPDGRLEIVNWAQTRALSMLEAV